MQAARTRSSSLLLPDPCRCSSFRLSYPNLRALRTLSALLYPPSAVCLTRCTTLCTRTAPGVD